MLRRVFLALLAGATLVLVVAAPAAAKFPPFSVRVSPTEAVVGQPVTVEIAFRQLEQFNWVLEPGYEMPRQFVEVRAVLANGDVSGSPGVVLVPKRDSTDRWTATFTATRTGRFAVVAFGNVEPQPPESWVPGPTEFRVASTRPLSIAERHTAVVHRTSSHGDGRGLFMATAAAVVALSVTGVAFVFRRRRTHAA
jgi:hypothetical protein